MQSSWDVEVILLVVQPAGHALGDGLGSATLPPAEKKPNAVAVQLAPAWPAGHMDTVHAPAEVAPVDDVVRPAGQGAQEGRGRELVPPGANVPGAQRLH